MARSFETFTGAAAPLMRDNIDAMTIAPRTPAEKGGATTQGGAETVRAADLFANLRVLADGRPNADFVLDRPTFREAKFLIAGRNFGCGSAREHAVWALGAFGLRCVIAPSFGQLFYGNCFKNGFVPITLEPAEVERLARDCAPGAPSALLGLDLAQRTLSAPDGRKIGFTIPEFRYRQLLEGLDEIDMTLRLSDAITAFQQRAATAKPWLYGAQPKES
jgi:3-isopropylmalate/(R)-2-methylmalate dehydratase small subunit